MKESKTIEKDGFVLYRDTLDIAMNALPNMNQRGELLTSINQFVNELNVTTQDPQVKICFEFIRAGIIKNAQKYEKKKREIQERKKIKISENSEISEISEISDTNINHNSNTNTNPNHNPNSNYNTNSFSIEEIKEILEREKIFLKKKSLEDFYTLNEKTYKWKYDPVSAARVYIERHPGALTVQGEKKLPPIAPTPQTPETLKNIKKFIDNVFVETFGMSFFQVYMAKTEILEYQENNKKIILFVPNVFSAEYFREKFENQLITEIEKRIKKKFVFFYAVNNAGKIAYITPNSIKANQ